ncbi:MAG TPA: hypothetical protein VF162_14235 [Streptosporangiaceae bacterium]
MTYGALAMTVGAVLFHGRDEARHDKHSYDPFRLGAGRADRGLRRPGPGDLDMIEDDYYRFLQAPRD